MIKWTNKQSETERLTNRTSEELIYPDGLLDRRQDGWMETDGDRQANIVSERQIDSDTLTLLGRQNTERYSDINTLYAHLGFLPFCINTVRCNINYSPEIPLYQKWQRWFVSKSVQFHKHLVSASYHSVVWWCGALVTVFPFFQSARSVDKLTNIKQKTARKPSHWAYTTEICSSGEWLHEEKMEVEITEWQTEGLNL